MKHTPSLKQHAAAHAKQSGTDFCPRRFSRELIVGLICLVVFTVLPGTLAHGQEGNDALFIDKDGNVTVGKNLKADKFEGDGSAITVKAAEGEKSLRITEALGMLVPIGTIMAYGGDVTKPEIRKVLEDQGWLPCDGSKIEVSKYKNLYDIIGNAFGSDGKSFYLPDMRGRFLRGVNHDATDNVGGEKVPRDQDDKERKHPISGEKVGGVVGSVQDDQIKAHSHQYTSPIRWTDKKSNAMMIGENITTRQTWETASFGGKETRPKNIYVNWIIKAKDIIR